MGIPFLFSFDFGFKLTSWTWSNRRWQELTSIILGISELKWTGMVEFNSDDHYIYSCGQESLRINGVALIVNKEYEMQYLGAISKMTEWSLFVSKANHSVSQQSKSMPQPVMLKKLESNGSMKTTWSYKSGNVVTPGWFLFCTMFLRERKWNYSAVTSVWMSIRTA